MMKRTRLRSVVAALLLAVTVATVLTGWYTVQSRQDASTLASRPGFQVDPAGGTPIDQGFAGAERYYWPNGDVLRGLPSRPVQAAWNVLAPDELVLGVTVGKEARAYPLNVLDDYIEQKAVNDTLDGQPILVTFCDLCYSGIVYSRKVGGQVLTLAADGRLWRKNMILYDQETESRWSQLTGRAQAGPLSGAALVILPSVVTDWQSWRREHPGGTVAFLPHDQRRFIRAYYRDFDDFVLGLDDGGQAGHWNLKTLSRVGVVNAEWHGQPVVAVLDRASTTARVYRRNLAERLLSFTVDGELIRDAETGSRWQPATGKAVAGQLTGYVLQPLSRAIIARREAWLAFHPDSVAVH
ncbi:MAG TPA: DUF3179 domain-containing (seleno)protein [Gemmataceae bacterium]|jgi:hypothetical protein|nr:DUF3179 domain-containing (seleno)protein [Gemmataceae bacterium]